ncbi:Alkyl transferase [Melia azedarach]|uniref:Alkyl transferase n=2 Tax=Melia azedarach TaxID=155640 RepID=A0ACC1XS34_MELAZ|nr:Alkyl transferase [Melia azedarach]KAJ4714065.1 Alkyl transferase [Melia azedarach]
MGRYDDGGTASQLFASWGTFMRRCLFGLLSVGPIPAHFAFIMDGNRRYAKKKNIEVGAGHKHGFSSLMSVLKYCYELGVKYVTIYAFSIENFKRNPAEVQNLMNLLLEKINGLLKEESIVNQYGVRVYFIGNLKLLSEPVRVAAEKVMTATANNSKVVLLVCLAYTSSDEIVHAVQVFCKHKSVEIQALNGHKASNGVINRAKIVKKINSLMVPDVEESLALKENTACNGVVEGVEGTERINGGTVYTVEESCDNKDEAPGPIASRIGNGVIVETSEKQGEHPIMKLVDVEKYMYMAVAPDPDILLRSSGETRLSNFLLWQTSNCLLYSPAALWPEIGLWHVVWAVLNFQRNSSYLEKKKKQL